MKKKKLEDYVEERSLPINEIEEKVIEKYQIRVNDLTPFTGLRIINIEMLKDAIAPVVKH